MTMQGTGLWKITVISPRKQMTFGPMKQLDAHILLQRIVQHLGVEYVPGAKVYPLDWHKTPHGISRIDLDEHLVSVRSLDEEEALFMSNFKLQLQVKAL